jgi:cbb3-type cytochrome oxidase maturation protein
MDVVILLILVSLALVVAGLIFFLFRLREGDFDHGERLALAPLLDDGETTGERSPNGSRADPVDSAQHLEPEGGNQHGSR